MNTGKIVLFLIFVFALLIFSFMEVEVVTLAGNQPGQNAGNPQADIDTDALKSFLDDYIPEQMELSRVPGLVITVVQGNEVLLAKGYGYADLENKFPMSSQTNIRAGSVSKSVTASAVILFAEQGILDLDAPVSEITPRSTLKYLKNHAFCRYIAFGYVYNK